MQKHNHILITYLLFFILINTFFGCKTLPKSVDITPLNLLDNTNDVFISIPKSVDPELISYIINSNVQGLTDDDISQITSKINTVYCGINNLNTQAKFQIAVDADIPVKYMPKVFNEKNGWNTRTYVPQESDSEYKMYSQKDFEISFPSKKIACIGRDIPEMLNKYEFDYSDIEPEIYDWVSSSSDTIRFYAEKVNPFVMMFTGNRIDLRIFNIKGDVVINPLNDEEYTINLSILFENEKYLKAGKTIFSMAINSKTFVVNDNELQINGINIKKDNLLKLFM